RLDSPALLYLIHDLSEAGADLRQLNAQMVEYWRTLMLAKAGADVVTILDLTEDEVHEVQQLTPSFGLEELTECARIFAQNDLIQKNQGTPQLGLELASLECTELHRRVQSGQPVVRQSALAPAPAAVPTQTVATRPALAALPQTSPAFTSPQRGMLHPESSSAVESRLHESATGRLQSSERGPSVQETNVTAVAPPSMQGYTRLGLPQVQASWDNVKKRTMQKNNLLATYIGMCDVIAVEEGEDRTTIVVRVRKSNHYSIITKAEDFPLSIDWALSTEFDQPCKVRLMSAGQTYVASAAQQAVSYSVSTMPPPQSAYLESSHHVIEESVPRARSTPARAPGRPISQTPEGSHTPNVDLAVPLANTQGVKENKRVPLSKEEAQQSAQQHPIMQEALLIFRATIQDIQPK
ncbi:MAG: hypothetical protein ACRDHZ_21105, partial [Ktedonobacteraceae bacterium]